MRRIRRRTPEIDLEDVQTSFDTRRPAHPSIGPRSSVSKRPAALQVLNQLLKEGVRTGPAPGAAFAVRSRLAVCERLRKNP